MKRKRRRRKKKKKKRERRRREKGKTGTRGNRTPDLLHKRKSKTRAEAHARKYLVNIGYRRRAAQKRVTGGRWRRIVLGHVLAEQVVRVEEVDSGSPRL